MIRYILSVLALVATLATLSSVTLSQRPTVAQLDEYRTQLRPLLDAIRQVESGGDNNATGDNGNAIGAYQIWRVYWQDATDWCKTLKGSYEDVRSSEYAERVVVAYWHRYARAAIRDNDLETLARVHNGGPKGHKKSATDPYWNKVSKLMKGK